MKKEIDKSFQLKILMGIPLIFLAVFLNNYWIAIFASIISITKFTVKK